MMSCMLVLLTKYCWWEQIKEDMMGRKCGMNGIEEKCLQGFGGETWRMKLLARNKHGLQNIVNVDPKEMGLDDVDWINLAQNRDKWWAVANALINLHVSKIGGNLLTIWGTVMFRSRYQLHGVGWLSSYS